MRNAIVALVVVIGVLAGFYGGYKLGQSNVSAATSSNNTSGRQNAAGNFFPGRGANANGAACPSPGSTPTAGSPALARGTVSNVTATSMTVTNAQCSVTITLSPATTVYKQVDGSASDLTNSETVTVTGTRNADGSVTATAVQITLSGQFQRPGGSTATPSPGG